MYYWGRWTYSLVQSFQNPWKVFFEARAHFSCCTFPIDVRKVKLAIPEIVRILDSTKQNSDTLSTLYGTIEEFLHVFYDQFANLQKCTWKAKNNSLEWKIFSENGPRPSSGWTLLEKTLDVEIMHLFTFHRFSRLWVVHCTSIQKLTRLWRHGEEQVHVLT